MFIDCVTITNLEQTLHQWEEKPSLSHLLFQKGKDTLEISVSALRLMPGIYLFHTQRLQGISQQFESKQQALPVIYLFIYSSKQNTGLLEQE